MLEKISDENEKIAEWRSIDKAKGTTLDLIGQDYKAYRISDDDETFRFIIFLHILISRAQGTIPSMVKILGTALNAKPEQFKVYKTGLRHIGIEIPWDNVQTLQMQKFIIKNIQNLLAMGYWIDEIIFRTSTPLPLYIGVGGQISSTSIWSANTVWWTGWKAKTEEKPLAGIVGRMSNTSIWKAKSTIWWSGWKANTTPDYYVGMAQRFITSSIWSTAIN